MGLEFEKRASRKNRANMKKRQDAIRNLTKFFIFVKIHHPISNLLSVL